jgi:hypothetical protein
MLQATETPLYLREECSQTTSEGEDTTVNKTEKFNALFEMF